SGRAHDAYGDQTVPCRNVFRGKRAVKAGGTGNARAEVKNTSEGSFIHTNGMIEMSKQLSLKVALILFLSAGPSAACDPEEMINDLRAQCRDAITSAVAH